MGKRKYTPYKPKVFESRGNYKDSNGNMRKDTSANIYTTMLLSDAYKDLKPRQQALYVVCKSMYLGLSKPRYDKEYKENGLYQDNEYFFMNMDVAVKYGLYKPNTKELYKDLRVLIEHGFIEKVSQGGGATKRKNVFKFSDKWQDWKPQ